MTKVIQNRVTKNKAEFKTVNDIKYTTERGLPMLILEDNSMMIFPGMELFTIMISNQELYNNSSINEEYFNKYIIVREDMDPEINAFEGYPINAIDVINIPKEEIAKIYKMLEEDVFIYKLYWN